MAVVINFQTLSAIQSTFRNSEHQDMRVFVSCTVTVKVQNMVLYKMPINCTKCQTK
jgi:hypothetical protein